MLLCLCCCRHATRTSVGASGLAASCVSMFVHGVLALRKLRETLHEVLGRLNSVVLELLSRVELLAQSDVCTFVWQLKPP